MEELMLLKSGILASGGLIAALSGTYAAADVSADIDACLAEKLAGYEEVMSESDPTEAAILEETKNPACVYFINGDLGPWCIAGSAGSEPDQCDDFASYGYLTSHYGYVRYVNSWRGTWMESPLR